MQKVPSSKHRHIRDIHPNAPQLYRNIFTEDRQTLATAGRFDDRSGDKIHSLRERYCNLTEKTIK